MLRPPQPSIASNTSFTVEELDANGCVNTADANVVVIPGFPSIEWDALVCER